MWIDKNKDARLDLGELITAKDAGIVSIAATADQDSPEGNYMSGAGVQLSSGESLAVWDWWSSKSPLEKMRERGSVTWKKGPVPGIQEKVKSDQGSAFEDGSLQLADTGNLTFYSLERPEQETAWFVRAQATLVSGTKVDTLLPANAVDNVISWGLETASGA